MTLEARQVCRAAGTHTFVTKGGKTSCTRCGKAGPMTLMRYHACGCERDGSWKCAACDGVAESDPDSGLKEGEVMRFAIANDIPPESWLNEGHYREFVRAYRYAMTQTMAIPALAKLHPEEAYYLFRAIERGFERGDR